MEFVIFEVIFAVFLAITFSGKQLNAAPRPNESRLSWDRAAGIKDPSKYWPGGVLPYIISEKFGEDSVKVIKNAMDLITQKTCVTFPERTEETDYLTIELANGCSSYAGRRGGAQKLILKVPGCGDHVGKVLHELMHAVGLMHEHSRPDRDKYITIFLENVKDGDQDEFRMFSWNTLQNLTVPYDLTSAMHYRRKTFSKNGKDTIVPKGNGTIPAKITDMSAGDTEFINLMYNCNTTEDNGSQDNGSLT